MFIQKKKTESISNQMLSAIKTIGDSVNENVNLRRRNEKGHVEILQRLRLCVLPLERFLNPTTTFVVLVQLTDCSVVNKIKIRGAFIYF